MNTEDNHSPAFLHTNDKYWILYRPSDSNYNISRKEGALFIGPLTLSEAEDITGSKKLDLLLLLDKQSGK